jgi:predicted small lipoprotein YifL
VRTVVAGLSMMAAVAALAACGGGGGTKLPTANGAAQGSSAASSEAAAGDAGAFCKQIINLNPSSIQSDSNNAKQALDEFKQLHPPAAIANQWNDYLAAIQEFASANQSDKAALAGIAARHAQSFAAVSAFISQSCASVFSGGITTTSS